MQISSIHETLPNRARLTLWTKAPRVLCIVALLVVGSLPALGATATTTTLTTGSKTVNSRTITTLTAKVATTGTAPVAVTKGLVLFKDGKVLLGTGQIVTSGTKYTHGAAYLSVELGAGTHSITAVFAGTAGYATSTSAAASVVITGGATSTTIGSTGTVGAYTLTGTVTANGTAPVTGSMNFIDQTDSNTTFGTAALGTATAKRSYATFSPVPLYNFYDDTNPNPKQVVLVDLNGDGILDMVDLDYDDMVGVHMGNGNGTFQTAKSYCLDTTQVPAVPCTSVSGGPGEPTGLAVGDFNGDGIPDLVFTDGTVYISLGNGDGTFQKPVEYATQGGLGSTQVLVADLNRDGAADLVVNVSGGLSILLGNGNGTFQSHYEVGLSDSNDFITIGDFNKDGLLDIASAGGNGTYLMVLLGYGNGTFKPEVDTVMDINPSGCTVAAADFKGTGYLSDIAMCGGDGLVEAMIGNGNGTFAAPQHLCANGTYDSNSGNCSFDEYAEWAIPVDMNGDGNVDLVMAWNGSDNDGFVDVFSGSSTGTFNATPTKITTGKLPQFVAAADLNGNGAPDLVTANYTDMNLSVISQSAISTATATLGNVSIPLTGNQSVVAQYAGDSHYATSTSSAITLTGSGGVAGAPTISSLSPSTVANGSGAFTMTVNGTNFATGAVVKWNGSARTTAFLSAVKLTVAISAADVAAAGIFPVTVTVGTQVSNAVNFTVSQSSTGPTITAISPDFATINSPNTTITVTGTNFVSGSSAVHIGSTALTTTFVNATTLTAVIPSASLKTLGTFSVTVWNGAAIASNIMPFTVGPVTHTPLAYGFFNKDGSAGATSGNITCTWSTTDLDYQCTITGESFWYSKYVVNATYGDITTVGIVTVNSNQSKVAVRIYKVDGTTKIQAPFYLVVFKP